MTSRQVLNISKEGNPITSRGNLCQCSVTCTVKKCCLVFIRNLLCSALCPRPLVMPLGTTEKSLASSSLHLPSLQAFINIDKIPPEPPLIQAENVTIQTLWIWGNEKGSTVFRACHDYWVSSSSFSPEGLPKGTFTGARPWAPPTGLHMASNE